MSSIEASEAEAGTEAAQTIGCAPSQIRLASEPQKVTKWKQNFGFQNGL